MVNSFYHLSFTKYIRAVLINLRAVLICIIEIPYSPHKCDSQLMASFAKLLRTSQFVKLGSFDGNIVRGKIVQRVDDDLYIDFGGKFNAICKRPIENAELVVYLLL